MQKLFLRTLGGVQITLGDRLLTGQLPAKAQALLCYLAVTGRPHSRPALAGLLWSDKPEAAALTNLRQTLSALRRSLGSHLRITRHSVSLEPTAPRWLDTEVFADKLLSSRSDAQKLQEAVEIYRGDFLEGFYVQGAPAFEEWAIVERERLRTMALEALHMLTTHHARTAEYATALHYATRLLAMAPWQEEAHRLKMLLLARSGRYTEALAQYERCRQVLAAELNVEPAAETTALYERIRIARSMRRHNLPSQPTPFVGRERELAEISRLLADPTCRLLTLIGPGGIGKTRLATRAAALASQHFLHGVRFIPLAPVPSPDMIATALVKNLDLDPHGHDLSEQVLDYLREKEMLLVLDGFEHLLEGAPFLSKILENAPDIKLLVTSRERLGLRWESLFAVEGLAMPPPDDDNSLEYDSVKLFVQLASRAHPNFAPEHEVSSIVQICRLVEGMPLGIELAAAWSGQRPCATIAHDLEHGIDLATPLQDVPRRHRSLRAAFEHSWQLLSDEERSVFGRLSVFKGGFDIEAAIHVAGASPEVLSALTHKSLLRRTTSGRYTMHELVRQYAADKLAISPAEEERVRQLHCAHYVALLKAQELALNRAEQREALQKIDGEIENVRRAWAWAVERGDVDAISAAMHVLSLFYDARGLGEEGSKTFEAAVKALQGPATRDARAHQALGQAMLYLGVSKLRIGEHQKAKESIEESLEILHEHGDHYCASIALNNLGIIYGIRGEYAKARELFKQSLELCDLISAPHRKAVILNNMGILERMLGEHERARRMSQESLEIYRQIGHRRGMALALQNLGLVAYYDGEFAKAQQLYQESMEIFRQLGDRWGMAVSLNNLGEAAREQGEYREAERALRKALALYRENGDQNGEVNTLSALGIVARKMGKNAEARRYLQRALHIAVKTGSLPVAMEALVELAALRSERNEREEAIEILSFIVGHPATEKRTAEQAQALASEVAATLPTPAVTAAQERGRRKSLTEVINEVGRWS